MDKKFVETDSDVESKYFIKTPFDKNDPELDWHKTAKSSSDESENKISNDDENSSDDDRTPHDRKRRKLRKVCTTSRLYPIVPDVGSSKKLYRTSTGSMGISSHPHHNSVSPQIRLNETYPVYSNSIHNSSWQEDSFENWSDISTSETENEFAPLYKGFQLIGDSQFLRFSNQVLSLKQCVTFTASGIKLRGLGYCISGQKIEDLHQRIQEKPYKISDKVIMMIGTNDFTHYVPFGEMCQHYKAILRLLKENGVKKIVLLTVPPVPRLAQRADYWIKLKRFNAFIMNLRQDGTIYTFDLGTLFVSYNNTVSLDYFEQTYNDGKTDLIHLNKLGLKFLMSVLNIHLEDQNII